MLKRDEHGTLPLEHPRLWLQRKWEKSRCKACVERGSNPTRGWPTEQAPPLSQWLVCFFHFALTDSNNSFIFPKQAQSPLVGIVYTFELCSPLKWKQRIIMQQHLPEIVIHKKVNRHDEKLFLEYPFKQNPNPPAT